MGGGHRERARGGLAGCGELPPEEPCGLWGGGSIRSQAPGDCRCIAPSMGKTVAVLCGRFSVSGYRQPSVSGRVPLEDLKAPRRKASACDGGARPLPCSSQAVNSQLTEAVGDAWDLERDPLWVTGVRGAATTAHNALWRHMG